MHRLLTRYRVLAVAAVLATAPALAVTAAPAAAHAASSQHRDPARLTALAYAVKHLGARYAYGAAGPKAFDCSGLTMKSYAEAGKRIGGHSATAQYRTARADHRLRTMKDVRKGDILFYGSPGSVYHVAMYAGKGKMIEAPHEGAAVRIVKVRHDDLLSQVADLKG